MCFKVKWHAMCFARLEMLCGWINVLYVYWKMFRVIACKSDIYWQWMFWLIENDITSFTRQSEWLQKFSHDLIVNVHEWMWLASGLTRLNVIRLRAYMNTWMIEWVGRDQSYAWNVGWIPCSWESGWWAGIGLGRAPCLPKNLKAGI